MESDELETAVRLIIGRVDWTDFLDPLGNRVDLSEPILRIALDERLPSESEFYGSGIGSFISNQGSMGGVTLPAVRVINELLELQACVDNMLLYELLEILGSSRTETVVVDVLTGRREVLWVAVFKEIYRSLDTYIRDFRSCIPSRSDPLMDLLCFLSPKFPEILQEFEAAEGRHSDSESEVIRARIAEIHEWMEDDLNDHDDRYDINP